MLTLKLLFLVAILIYSLYSLITYYSRRSESKSALQQLAGTASVRELTAQEQDALAPFLIGGSKPAAFSSHHVYRLTGAFVRHGISTQGGTETMHDTLGDVEIILPYDAQEYLTEYNQAEVVLAEKFAIVVALNSQFNLLSARQRARLKEIDEHQWKSGKAGETAATGFTQTHKQEITDAEEQKNLQQMTAVRLVLQRDETPAEISARTGLGLGWLAL
jgi:hypothetical protein